jgi:osmotically-inducible protein OsmY
MHEQDEFEAMTGGYEDLESDYPDYRSQDPYRREEPSRGWRQGASQRGRGSLHSFQPGYQGSSSQYRRGTSQISYAGRGPQGYRRSDERITEDVNEMLTQDPEIDASHVTVEVRSGEVTLKGSVSDRQAKRRAEDIAESCSGVKEVQNQLRVRREEEPESESRRDKNEEKQRSQRQQIAS